VSDDALAEGKTPQGLTATTFVEIVDTLVGDFDVIEVLTLLTSRCVELLAAGAAGILLADNAGHLSVVGASTEQIQTLELFQVQNDEGPCLDCYRTGQVVLHSDLDTESPWPLFAAECNAAGFASVCAVPLRLKADVLGCLNMFMPGSGGLTDSDVAVAQALADFASIAIIQEHATREAAIREGHLQRALTSRILIEQAKGMIAERRNIDMDEAFASLRTYARNNNRGLTAVSKELVDGTITVDVIRRAPPPASPPPSRK
jgi:GAF domain-containing protein